MRIIAGTLGGRQFDSPAGHKTHPMSERVRAALFNVLGDINGLTVLDAFAGSGALTFEAISRGAASGLMIDADRRAQDTLQRNIKSLGLGSQVRLVKANAGSWSQNNPNIKFDIVIVAPPYDHLQISTVEQLSKHMGLQGIYILDWPGKILAPDIPSLSIVKQKNYGDAQLVFYKNMQ